jgi:hypothetical protein
MSFQNTFSNIPILSWAVDDWKQFYDMLGGFDMEDYLKRYKERSYDNKIRLLFDNAPLSLNLGGVTEKHKLKATDKPIGIFDFSMASRGLYRVPEYFSQKLASEYPEKFKEFELPSGVVPNNLVKEDIVDGEKFYYYDTEQERFDCVVQQKGTAAIDQKLPDAKLKFATRNKKVYLTYNRKRGKVKYVEIYSLFYYTSLSGDVQYAVRHIPAMMVAEYLESIGVMTRIYMTRFVAIGSSRDRKLIRRSKDGILLPMADDIPDIRNKSALFVQPIIAKEFGQEFEKELGFLISSRYFSDVYETIARESQKKEITDGFAIYGNPDWEQNDYWEGVERYRNKYIKYVKAGVFKSKEVVPEAMLFFHDMAIKNLMAEFISTCKTELIDITGKSYDDAEFLIDNDINPFFNWWMRMSAANLKNKINIINSLELRKDLATIDTDLQKMIDEIKIIISNLPNINGGVNPLKSRFETFYKAILKEYSVFDRRDNYSFKNYIISITTEITTYADGVYYNTDQENIDKRNALVENVLTELQNF